MTKKVIKILEDYDDKVVFHIVEPNGHFCWCDIVNRIIYIDLGHLNKKSDRVAFDILHEIGHLSSIPSKLEGVTMFGNVLVNAEDEYNATAWAIKNCKKYNIKLTKKTKKDYDDYIQSCCNHMGIKNIYHLKWED